MRYPLVKQGGLKNCGPCSLASIIKYYKGYVSVDTLEDMMKTSLSGTSAYNLIEASRKIGFESYGMKLDTIDNVQTPFIAYVKMLGIYKHFIVVYKVGDKVLIADPASKVKYITKEEFYKIWENIVITLKPIKKLPKIKVKSLYSYIGSTIKKYIIYLIYIILISFLSAFISLVYSLSIKYILSNIDMINSIYIPFLILLLTNYFLISYCNYCRLRFLNKINIDITCKANESLILLPYMYYKNHKVGEILSRYLDINSVINYIDSIITLSITLPTLILFLSFMYFESVILFKVTILILFIYVIYNIFNIHFIKNDISNIKRQDSSYISYLNEVLNGFETIKGINIENIIIKKLENKNIEYKNTLCNTYKKYNIRGILSSLIFNIGSIYILFKGFNLYSQGIISIGSLVTYYLLYVSLEEKLEKLSNFLVISKDAYISSRRIQELFHSFTSPVKLKGLVEYKNLYYKVGYKYILKNISFKIYEGDKTFLYGKNGSGKSTLMKMLKGYIKTDNLFIGGDKIDGKLENVLYISKNEILFEDSLYKNLMCEDNTKIKEILKMCHITISLDYYIEENGFNLSSGERAKIILARTLLKPFDILILDEILNEIDVKTERQILKSIFDKYKDKTVIVIAHRFNNMDLFNHYIRLSNGKVILDSRKEKICGFIDL